MPVKEEEMKAKAKKEVWCEGWRRIKEEKVRLADEREREGGGDGKGQGKAIAFCFPP